MLTLLPPAKVKVSESGTKWKKSMVLISTAGANEIGLKSLCVMFIKIIAMAGHLASQPDEHIPLHRSICFSLDQKDHKKK